MPSAGFKTEILAAKRPQTYALERAVTGISGTSIMSILIFVNTCQLHYY
jgi:hypothetical protein